MFVRLSTQMTEFLVSADKYTAALNGPWYIISVMVHAQAMVLRRGVEIEGRIDEGMERGGYCFAEAICSCQFDYARGILWKNARSSTRSAVSACNALSPPPRQVSFSSRASAAQLLF